MGLQVKVTSMIYETQLIFRPKILEKKLRYAMLVLLPNIVESDRNSGTC